MLPYEGGPILPEYPVTPPKEKTDQIGLEESILTIEEREVFNNMLMPKLETWVLHAIQRYEASMNSKERLFRKHLDESAIHELLYANDTHSENGDTMSLINHCEKVLKNTLDLALETAREYSQNPEKITLYDVLSNPNIQKHLQNCIDNIAYSLNSNLIKQYFKWISGVDHLTGLNNASSAENYLLQLLTNKEDFGLMFFDVNKLKDFNTALGEDTVDRLLAQTGIILQQAIRDQDFLARIAGDQFWVMVKGAGEKETALVGERISNALKSNPIALELSAEEMKRLRSQGLSSDPSSLANKLLRQLSNGGNTIQVLVSASMGVTEHRSSQGDDGPVEMERRLVIARAQNAEASAKKASQRAREQGEDVGGGIVKTYSQFQSESQMRKTIEIRRREIQ